MTHPLKTRLSRRAVLAGASALLGTSHVTAQTAGSTEFETRGRRCVAQYLKLSDAQLAVPFR